MKKRRILFTILAIVMVLLMLLPMLTMVLSSMGAKAGAVTQSDITELQDQQAQLQQRQKDLQSQIDSSQYERSQILDRKAKLDEQVQVTQSEIDNLQAQIDTYVKLIAQRQEEYNQAQATEEYRLDLFKKRVRAMEEEGPVSYWSILFKAKNFSDLLGRMDFVSDIMASDEAIVKSLEEAKAATAAARTELENSKSEKESAMQTRENKVDELNTQIASASALIQQIDADAASYQVEYQAIADAEAALDQKILEMTQELERQRAAEEAERARVKATGRYIWPSNCLYVTDKYGPRINPVTGIPGMHNGIDIGASYGTDIFAADGGTIESATYSSSYGNYVMIYHGNSRYTLYAHMSRILVDVGQTVSQGEVIGRVGTTGQTTGAHIHFEIIEGGSYVNPLNYFSNYIPMW